ncbi:hypothetical protein [Prosthecobacter sp.]|uniref:hypothetical protein n=1 Tax=Prosthecobacter sp. TaxID=1965333 RepID=UPI0037848E71
MPFKSDHALELIARARDNGRLGHAYLITGPKEAQHEVFAARMLDLIVGTKIGALEAWEGQGAVVLRPQSKSRRITIGDDGDDPGTIRYLEKMIHRTAAPNGWKLAIIVDAERMNVQAQNAFLKTLEEPPPNTLLLLLSTQPEQLLPTIQSRVLEVALMPPVGARIFTEHEGRLLYVLKQMAKKEGGSISAALSLKKDFEEILEAMHEAIKKDQEADFEREQDHYAKTTDGAWLKQREEQVEAQIEADYLQQRTSLMELLLSWMGDVARQQAGAPHLDLPKFQEATAALAAKWEPGDVAKRIRVLRQLESHLHTNVNEGLALEVCFIEAFA